MAVRATAKQPAGEREAMSRKRARLELVVSAGWAHCNDAREDGQGGRCCAQPAAQGDRQLEERVIALCAGVVASRSFAAAYAESASRSLARARTGRCGVDGAQREDNLDEDHLGEASRASRQARKCLRFARLCERRASSLATQLSAEVPATPDAAPR
jgi:hypothetical protein